jgi:hypothetical protein
MAVPTAATDLVVSVVASDHVTLTWTDPNTPNVVTKIYGATATGVFSLLATLTAGVNSYTSPNLSPNTAYSFYVSMSNVDGDTDCAAVSTRTTSLSPVVVMSSLGLTFNDLILRVAEYLGVCSYASTVAEIPTDTHDLDLCKRVVNDGYARFLNDYKWEFLNVTMQLTPDGINYEYELPYDFQGEFLTTWTYPTSGPVAYMKECPEQHLRMLRAGRATTGYPSLFAISPKATVDATTTGARWLVNFWPTPVSTIETLTARYRRLPMALSATTDRSVAGPQHDQAVKQAAIAAAEIQRYGEAGPQETLYQSLLAGSIKRDVRNVPRSLGYNGDGSDERHSRGHWPSRANQVDSYNGVQV